VRLRLLLIVGVLAPVVAWSQAQIERLEGRYRAQEEVLYLWSGEQVKRLLPGFEGIAADLYWLRTVQYFGGERAFAAEKRFELLLPLIEITTTLDPRLEIAYRYGAVFLSEAPPAGAGRPRDGIELLKRGACQLPDSWPLQQQLGFFQYLFLHDSVRAAAALEKAGKQPGAPFWFHTLAADLVARGGDRVAARRMWQQMLDQSEVGVLKENARLRLALYDALDLADHLATLVSAYETRTGRRPQRLEDLSRAGLWRGRCRMEPGFASTMMKARVACRSRGNRPCGVRFEPAADGGFHRGQTIPHQPAIAGRSMRADGRLCGSRGGRSTRFAREGRRVPAFETTAIDGKVQKVDFPAGSQTVLLFFLSGCSACHKMIPEWNRAYQRRPKQLRVVGVLMDQEPPGFWSTISIQFPVLRSPGRLFLRSLKVNRAPLALRVGPGGRIEDFTLGVVDPIRLGEIFRP